MFRTSGSIFLFLLLTLLTQIGGIAWLLARRRKRRLLAFSIAYTGLTVITLWIAPMFGRIPLSCFEDGPLQVQSPLYCAMNRHYVSPEIAEVLEQVATSMEAQHPGTVTLVLDGNFPFFDGFPLLPHLSHDDGDKVDLAFYYADETGYLPGATRSPIGYFAFEAGPTDCPKVWPTLRWDFGLLQGFWQPYEIETERTRSAINLLADNEAVGKIFVEPHLVARMGLSHPKIRFQGCRAARHDDHIHFQL